jgi:hypothetical protein
LLSDVTRILESIQKGDPRAADELLSLVYTELHKRAAYKMTHNAAGHMLQPTALVHEVWMRLLGPAAKAEVEIQLPAPPAVK